MKKIIFIIGTVLILASAIWGAVTISQKPKTGDHKLSVITTLFPLYDFANIIGGDKVNVVLLLPPGVESHSFEPKPSDVVKINESDFFVYTGKYMETWAEDIINGMTNKNVKVIDSSIGIQLAKDDEHEHEGVDPHIWLGFDNAQIMVDNIANAFTEKDPDNAAYYKNNAGEYKSKLVALDNEYRTTLTKCESKDIVYGGHYAFGYLSKRYGLQYFAAQGISPDAEPTANDLISLVDQIRKNNIKYIFYEELTSPKISETLAKETGSRMLLLNAAHNLSKDDFENKVTYISIMEKNLNNLSIGLGCNK